MPAPAVLAGALLALAAFGGGCGGCGQPKASASSARIEASCDKRVVLSQCNDYFKGALDGGRARALLESCKVVHGVFGDIACPLGATWVGSCQLTGGEVRHYYNEGGTPFRVEGAKRECAVAEGAWRPRP